MSTVQGTGILSWCRMIIICAAASSACNDLKRQLYHSQLCVGNNNYLQLQGAVTLFIAWRKGDSAPRIPSCFGTKVTDSSCKYTSGCTDRERSNRFVCVVSNRCITFEWFEGEFFVREDGDSLFATIALHASKGSHPATWLLCLPLQLAL